jgi:hypothetical protein
VLANFPALAEALRSMTRLRRHPLALLLLVLVPLGLGGCLFDHPLTNPENLTSPNLDSRFTGVFEFREPKDKTKEKEKSKKADKKKDKDEPIDNPDDYNIQRMAVLPVSANHYVIYYRDFSKKPTQTHKFLGWISRVDQDYYISFQDETDGSPSRGKYGFFKFVWEFPGDFRLYAPDAKEFEGATSSYQMRRLLRAKLRNNTAFPYEATEWKKIARIWWNPLEKPAEPQIPKEFESGTTLVNPGL